MKRTPIPLLIAVVIAGYANVLMLGSGLTGSGAFSVPDVTNTNLLSAIFLALCCIFDKVNK